jgi:hypothetical protein
MRELTDEELKAVEAFIGQPGVFSAAVKVRARAAKELYR